MKRIVILPAIGLIGWFVSTTYLDYKQDKRLDSIEAKHAVQWQPEGHPVCSGIWIGTNGIKITNEILLGFSDDGSVVWKRGNK